MRSRDGRSKWETVVLALFAAQEEEMEDGMGGEQSKEARHGRHPAIRATKLIQQRIATARTRER